MKREIVKCPYCGAYAMRRPASVVYGDAARTENGYLFVCSRWPACDAYVSAHLKSGRPMGTLANGDLRHKRILAHKALDEFRKRRHIEKWEAYLWLQSKLGLGKEQTHIAMFSEYRCDQVIALCKEPESGRKASAA